MISNMALPSTGVGSWTKMFDYFNEQNSFFDFILSPGISEGRFIHCKKRIWPTYFKPLRKFLLLNWVAKDFLKTVIKLSKGADLLKVLVQDDIILLEALADLKRKNSRYINIELIFYFHGYELIFNKNLDEIVDKVLFLSYSSYQHSLKVNLQFTPEVFIIGNFINHTKFYASDEIRKIELRKKFGIPTSCKVVTWMANDRRVKGLHLFSKLIPILSKFYPDLYFLIIGSNTIQSEPELRIKSVGRISQNLLAEYLRSSDIYFFPSLWKEGFGLSVLEARLCGNWILSTSNGSLKEVLSSFSHVYFVDNSNIIVDWLEAFHLLYSDFQNSSRNHDYLKSDFYSYNSWVKRFEFAIG